MNWLLNVMEILAVWVSGHAMLNRKTSVLRVNAGELRGVISHDGLIGEYHSYLGIPYARAEEKFQAAKPVTQWLGVFEATNGLNKCLQRSPPSFPSLQQSVSGTEDCLTLNVFSLPKSDSDTKLRPVMVFIHGGGFRDGSSNPLLYGPAYFVRHDIILVTINYRVEILGFLCLGIKEAPGNVGLKDQTIALKWAKENIKAFGGDPNNVTIFGESAGAASVVYHLLSPMSRGLFGKAIMQSGSAMSPWAFQFEPLKIASELGKQMGYDTKEPYELLKIFKSKTFEELLSTRVPRKKGDIVQSENIFVPCAEDVISGEESFITNTPYNIIAEDLYAKVPMLLGYNNAEGYLFAGNENITTIENMNFYAALPRDLKFPNEKVAESIAYKLKNHYLGNKTVSKANLIEYEGDSGTSYPVTATIDMVMKTNDKPIYTYKFSYGGLLNIAKMVSGFSNYPGAAHADDIFYMFKPAATDVHGYYEMEMIDKITTMWTNFAKFGNPTPKETFLLPMKWHPTTEQRPHLLVIDRQFSTERLWNSKNLKLWMEIYSQYRKTEKTDRDDEK